MVAPTHTNPDLKNLYITFELCRSSERIRQLITFYLIDRLVYLILTFSISIITTERSFSAMKIMKTRLCNRMEDEFLTDNMVIYIEK